MGLVALPLSAQIAQVQHAPSINGKVNGSLQQMSAEGVTLNSGANITGDLSVPGTPTIQLNGSPTYAGTLEGSGTSSPSNYAITLNTGASLRHVIRRTNAVSLPTVAAVAVPTGTTSVTVNSAGQSISWATLKNLTLNSNAGQYTVPAGSYGSFSAGSGSGFKLGVTGATQASVYNFQNLTLNGNSTVQILGPVVINLANGFSANAPVGASTNPAWLNLNIKSGGFTLNSGCNFYGYLLAPSGQVIINAGTQLVGGVACANLTINSNGLLTLQSVQASNQPPTVSLTTPANGSIFHAPASVSLSANAADGDGTVAKVEFFQGSTKIGQSTTAPYTYAITSLAEGSYHFFARATDNLGATTDSAQIAITVTCANKSPVVTMTAPTNGASFIAPASIAVTATASDPDGSIAHVDFYQDGVLLGSDTNSPYSINTGALLSGTYIFSAKAYDNAGASTTSGNVTVTIVSPNQPPTAFISAPSNNSTFDNPAAFTVTAGASDTDGSITKVEFFRNGALQATLTQAPYQLPVSGLPIGTYDFVVRATDNSSAATTSAAVRVTVVHINDAPVAEPQSRITAEDTPVSITLSGVDPDGDLLSYAIGNPPVHGSLAPGSQPNIFIYTPAANFNGNDSFTFKVSDGALQSAAASVQLTVSAVNDAPVSAPSSITLNENTSTSFTLAGTDVDSSGLTFAITSGPVHGTYSGTLPNITYTPAIDYSGSDSFVYTVSDGVLTSDPAAISLTINHVNRAPTVSFTAPVANSSFISPANFALQTAASDSDGTVVKVELFQNDLKIGETSTTPYQFDVTSLVPGNYSYFARATDNSGAVTDSAILPVTVVANIPPTATLTSPVDGATLTAPAIVTVSANAMDSDGAIAHVDFYQGSTLIGQSSSAPFNFTTGALTAGTYSFSAKAYDNLGAAVSTGVATITVINPNQPPSVSITAPASGTVVAGPATITVAASASDADGTVAKVEFFNGITKIGEVLTVPYTFIWSNVTAGDYSLFARATDSDGSATDSVPVSIQVTPPNVPPAVTLTTPLANAFFPSSAPVVLSAVATDGDGAIAKVEFFDGSAKIAEVEDAPYTFSWTTAASGTHVLTARATDSSGATTDSLDVTIAINTPPVANSKSLNATGAATFAIRLTGSDLETAANSLIYIERTQPAHGTLTGIAPDLIYTPIVGFEGTDHFDFIVNDGVNDSLPATIAITVAAPNGTPVVDAGEDRHIAFVPTNGSGPQGRIVVNNDEWALTDQGFSSSPYAGAFARNLADFLTGGKPGAKFLAYTNVIPGSVDFIYTGANLAAAMAAAGHTWVTNSTIPMTLANLKQYDAVFIGASVVDNQVLIDYVEGGGSVYLSAGTHWCGCDAEGEAALWNTFLEHFGLHYNSPYNGVSGTLPVFSDHPLFYGIKTLYFQNGNSVAQLNPNDPYTSIPFIYSGQGLFGIYGYDLDQVFLHGTVTDDGRPNPPASVTYTWIQVGGPGTATLDAPNSLTTRARFNEPGVYVFRLTANDGAATSSDEVTVTLNTPPQVYAGPDQSILNLSRSATLAGSVTDDNVAHPPTILWKSVLGPGPVVFGSVSSSTTTAQFSVPGRYVLELSADDGLEVRSDYVEVGAALIYPFEGPSGMVAWWPGNGTPVDIIGGHNGVLKNGTTYSVGQVSLAFGLDGVDDRVEVPAHPDLNLGASAAGLTVELWAKPDRNQDVPLVQWSTTTAEGLSLRQWNGGTGLYAFLTDTTGNGHQISAENMFVPNVWAHLAVTYDKASGLARLYRNGVIVRELNLGVFTPQTTYPLEFGSLVRESRFYRGVLDEITVYNRPLAAAEINAIYQASGVGKAPPDNNQPPVISAGANIVLPDITATASLNGRVTDDGHPENGALSLSWAKVDGPGAVVFGNPALASTTATFTAPGIYLLRLDANDGINEGIGSLVTVTVGVNTGLEPASGIAAWWPGNGDSHEVIHGNHDMEMFQGMTYTPGKVSEAFSMDGINDYGRVAAHSDLNLGASAAGLTVELWAKPGRNQDVPLVQWSTTTAEGLSLRQWNGGTGLYAFLTDTTGNGHQISAENMFIPNVWAHLAMTYDKASGLARLYRNGIIVRELNLGVFTPQTIYPLEFGSLVRENRFYQGTLDEITFYNRPLSAAEINAVYLAGAAGKTPPDDNLPPVVSAGPDVMLANTAATASLNGNVTDDSKPFGAPVILWTLLDGPGTVNFGNASLATTTATFSAPGIYLLQLTASDRYLAPVSDLTEVRVGVVAVQSPTDIAAWWPGNGNPHEVIHGNHDMEMFQGMTYTPGKVSEAFSMDGINDYSRVAAHSDLNLGASAAGLTVELWAKPGRNQDVPLVQWSTTTAEGLSLRQWNGGTGLYAFLTDTTGNGHQISAENMFIPNVWAHLAVTYDKASGLARLYRNGIIVRELNLGVFTPQTTYPLEFGSLMRENRFYQGALDEITFYKRALSSAEIIAIYNAGAAGKAPFNTAPIVNAGPDTSATIGVPLSLNGSGSDDGLPNPPGTITCQWSEIAGPGTATFSSETSPSTSVSFSTAGTYILRLTASDSILSGSDDLTVTVVQPPTVVLTAPADNAVTTVNAPVTLSATATAEAAAISKVEFFDGAAKLGEDLTAPYSLLVSVGFTAGTHTLTAKATAADGGSAVSPASTLSVLSSPPPAPVLELSTPISGAEVTAPVNVVGTISGQYLKSYVVQVRYKTSANDSPWKTGATGTNAVTNNVLGQLDPTLLPNGLYEIRLSATDQLNRTFDQLPPFNWVSIIGGMKIGANTSTSVDLTVSSSGLPLSVVRHYDSTDPRVGDFGVGTTLANREYSVQVSQRLGADWYAYTVSGFQGLPQYIIDPAPPLDATGVEPEPRVVSITLPDNTTFRFSARLTPNKIYTEIVGGQIVFDAMPGTIGQLEAVNESTFEVENDVLADSGFGFTDLLGIDDGEPLNPTAYRLTTLDGTQYIVSTTKGVLKVTDRNGSSTTYSPNRIAQSNGSAIDLIRDASGRISAVKDPSGQSVNYAYDPAGRLLTVTDRDGRVTTYGYFEGTSLVTSIQQPGAILPEYDAYDAIGRLTSRVDGSLANGDVITERDLANRIEKHRDALGRTTIAEYDEFGNVVRRTDALGYVTKYAFTDSRFRDKTTAVTDAEGGVTHYHFNAQGLVDMLTDANGHATSYTYNANGQLLSETDALGHATVQTYDVKGNLLTRTDREGNTTTFTYDDGGNVLTEHSPLGNEIRYTYNTLGLPLTESEYAPDGTLGRKRSYTYDVNGKLSSDTIYRTDAQGAEVPVTTSYQYDLNGQPTKTTYPDATFSTKVYNSRGLLASETDRSGKVVNYTYDAAGRLTRTTFADDSYEEKIYDAVGRVTSERNALGQIATNTYDDDDHLLSIDFPGIGTQSHTYDKVGRMLTDTDEGGRVTTTAYDPVGNVTKIGYPDGTSTDLVYDDVDALKSASARVFFAPSETNIAYDPIPSGVDLSEPGMMAKIQPSAFVALSPNPESSPLSHLKLPFGYRVEPARFTSHKLNGGHSPFAKLRARVAQASPTSPPTPEPHLYQYAYDANGRMKSITNPDGSSSRIEYDAIGRPTQTTNELGQIWKYEYDPSSNDSARRTAVKGPLGYVESYLYGPNGDVEDVIDPLGNITEYHYNAQNQCTDIKYSDSHGALFSTEIFSDFDSQGNARHITDREGFETVIDDKRTPNSKSGNRVLTRKVGSFDYVTTETYDEAGNLKNVVDPRGAVTKYDYDFFNRRTLTTLPDGRIIQTVYGPRNRVEKVHEIASDGTDTHTTEYQYDNNDKVTKTTRSHKIAGENITVDSGYVADGRVKSISAPYLPDETPRNTSLQYDDVSRVVTITDPMGRVTVRKQDKLGRLTDDTDTAGTTTHRDYDDLNRLTAITVTGQPDPVTGQSVTAKTSMTYDAVGNILSRTEAAGTPDARTTSFSYAYQGNGTLVTTTFADGSTSQSLQDTRGLVISTTTPRGNTTTTKYDALGRPTEITAPLGQKTTYTYPDLGESQVATDALGRTITQKFDLSQRLIEEKLPGTFSQRAYTYDSFSKLKTTTNTRGYTTAMEYDFMGRPAKVTRPDASTIATTYTAAGQPRRITDARGVVTQYDYDPVLHHLISVTAAEGDTKARTTAYGYDAADRINQVTAPNGQITDSVFDALGRLTKRTAMLDADGTKYTESFTYYLTGELKVHSDIRGDTAHVYDAIGHLKTLTDPLNQVTKTEYDSEGNLLQTTDALARVTQYTYDELGRLTTMTLPQGAIETNEYDAYHLTQTTLAPTAGGGVPIVTELGYDDLDHVTTITRHHSPDNAVESRAYDGEGLLTKAIDEAGYATSYGYNPLNQLEQITHPDTSTESFTYDGQGNRLTHERLPIADNHTYTYTPHAEIETITDALGHTTSYTYDSAGNQLTATDPLGRVTTNEYDYANRLRKVTLPGNRVSTFDYDTVGNRVAVTDPANRTRRFEYDSLGRLKRALTPLYNTMSAMAANHSDPSGSVVDIAGQKFAAAQLTYDPVGNLETLTDPNNHTTRFKYDAGNRLTHTYLPANPTTAYEINTYDYAGRRATRADADGATTIYGYDSLSHLTSVQPPSARIGATVTYAYDPRGLRTSMTDGLGTTSYTYDNRGRLHTEQTPYAGSLTYTHDELGRLINQHSSNVGGVHTTYRYDDVSRLTNVTDALRSETTTYDYNDADQLARVAQPNGTVTTQTYDPAGRPDTVTTARGTSLLFSQQYTYTPSDQVDTVTTTISRPVPFLPLHNVAAYTYDSSDRLLRENYAGDTINGQTDYTLDPASNRTARSSTIAGVSAQSFLYDANNALASLFTYDTRGNPTAGPLFPGSFNDTYDFLDHHAERAGTVEYLSDGDGRRVGHRAFDPVSGRWITHTRLISSLNPTGYDQDVEEFTDGVMTSSYTIGRSRLAGERFVDEATTSLGLTIALGADGKVYAWGNGQSTPAAVPGLANIIGVGAGASHYLALGADGKVYSWGASNGSGQLGRGGDIGTPTIIPGLDNVAAISTQLDHTLALTTDGTVYAWGDNSSGQLGDGTTTNRNAPIAVATGAVSIAAGQVHSYALMLDGKAEAWGDNTYGQLGQTSAVPVLTPTMIPELTGVSELAAGAFHALALKADGTLVTWGDNTFGQLGDPAALPSRGTPTPIAGISGLTAIAAGARHSLALQSDGTLLAWGENRSGQLGTAYPANLYTPTVVPGLGNLTHVAAGARSSYVTTAAGATYAMGANRNGQLGIGNTADASTPQLLPSGTNPAFAAIASGGESSASRTTHAVSLRDQFFAPDAHDHTRLLTDVTGSTTQTYSYDAFGNLLNATDASGYSLPATRYPLLPATNPYLYRGERLEAETGRYHLRARDYDAGLGRLATLDTYAGDAETPMSLNRYAYTEANPVGNADPSGHFSLSVWELLGQMDEVNRQWDEIASVGRQEEFDPEQAYNNFRNAIAGIPSGPLTVTKKERAIWMNASRQGGLIGSLAGESAGVLTEKNGIKGYADGSDVFFHTNANPRHRLSMIERTVEQVWASAYNLRHTINTGLPITSTDPKAWQTRWPAHLYHDAMLQAQLRSQMIEGPVEARFTLSLNRKLYNHARVALTASAVKSLSAAQSGGLLEWQSPGQPGTQGIDASFLRSVKSTGFAGLGQGELFARNLISGRDNLIKDAARPLGVLQALGGLGEVSAGYAFAIPSFGTSLIFAAHGADHVATGIGQAYSGEYLTTTTQDTLTSLVGQKAANFIDLAASIGFSSPEAVIGGLRLAATAARETAILSRNVAGIGAEAFGDLASASRRVVSGYGGDAQVFGRAYWQASQRMGIVPPNPFLEGANAVKVARQAKTWQTAETANPMSILYTQPTVSQNFSTGQTLNETVDALRSGELAASDLPTIRVVEHNGSLYSLDNRRLVAFQNAGISEIPIQKVSLSDPAIMKEFLRKFNPVNGGENIVVTPNAAGRGLAEAVLKQYGKIR